MGRYRDVELDEVELTGERLLLRRWRAADAADVHTIMADCSMREFLALPDPYTLEVATAFVTDIGHEGRGSGQGLGCAVVERDSGRLVGAAALRLAAEADIGYWVARAARGHGYAAEATRLLLDWGFGLGVHRVRLDCDVSNVGSVRTAMATGFSFEGVAREAGSPSAADTIITAGAAAPAHGSVQHRADIANFARLATDPTDAIRPAFAALPVGGLSDGVITLRPVLPGDAVGMEKIEDDVARGWSFTGKTYSAASFRHTAARSSLDWLVSGPARMAIVDVGSGELAGMVGLRSPGPPEIAAIGYGVHPAFRGRGYTARALQMVSSWAFEQAGLARLELGAKRGNLASQRAAHAAGFRPDGERTARLRNPDGGFSDEIVFGLVNPRYR